MIFFTKLINTPNINLNELFAKVLNESISQIQKGFVFDFNLTFGSERANDYEFTANDSKWTNVELLSETEPKDHQTKKIYISKGKKGLYFNKIRLNDITLLNNFLTKKEFKTSKNENDYWEWKTEINIQKGVAWVDIAEQAKIFINFNNEENNKEEYYLYLDYIGGDGGGSPGVDIGIIDGGTGDGNVSFNIEEINKTKTNEINFNHLKNNIINKAKNISRSIKNKIFSFGNNITLEKQSRYFDELIEKALINLIDLIDNTKQEFFNKKYKFDNKWKDKDGYKIENNFTFFDKNNIQTNINNTIINKILQENNLILNITYNDFPIFELSNNQKINAYQNETESVYHKIRNSINVNDFINISNNKNIETNQYTKSNEKIIELDENNQVIIPKDVKEYIPQLVNDNINNHIRTYTNGIWYSLYAYNQNLTKYIEANSTKFDSVLNSPIKNKIISKENLNNLLVLKNNSSFENMYYANHLSKINDFNESLYENKSEFKDKLIYNKVDLENQKNLANKIKPSKIVVLFNVAGQAMNPGLAIDDDLVINTSSNALYDTEQNILDNVLRTLLIEKASDKFYYKNEDGTYSLVKNETNFVYSLKWENKIYHFLTYVDAKNYLNEILKLEAMKVSL